METMKRMSVLHCRKQFASFGIKACLFILFFMCAPFTLCKAQIFNYSALQGVDDYFVFAEYRIYVPDTVSIIKGVYCYLDGSGGDSRSLTADTAFRKLCNETGFAFMGAHLNFGSETYHNAQFGLDKSVVRALYSFAGQSHHPEIQYAPIFLEGYSEGAYHVYYFTWWRPEIVLGFIAQKFTPITFNVGPAIKVPAFLIYDAMDAPGPIPVFELLRPKGALWSVAMEPNGVHDKITDRNLLDTYFKDVIKLRLPSASIPGKPVLLNTVDQSIGWLGDRISFNIAQYDSFPGDKLKASWLPARDAALRWQKFVRGKSNIEVQNNNSSLFWNPDLNSRKQSSVSENSDNYSQPANYLNKSEIHSQSSIPLSQANASFTGEAVGDNAGYSIASAGDVNGDGFSDFLIGAPGKDGGGLSNTNSGITYLLLGNAGLNWGKNFDLSKADASFMGEAGGDYSGCSVASAGDVNGDGLDDFIIGARGSRDGGIKAGKTYLILGRAKADWGLGFDLSKADASFIGEASADWSGAHVSAAGDVNGDGLGDFIIGAEGKDIDSLNQDAGGAYLILGRAKADWGQNFSLAKADASFIGETALDGAGYSVSSAGDVNGDGLADFLIGTMLNFKNEAMDDSKTYLILGKRSADWGRNFNLSKANASFIGENRFDMSGYSVASVGDINGDGLSDFLIGARDNSGGEYFSGQAYLLLGRARADWGINFKLSNADASFTGEGAFDAAAFSVASAGDVNGDSLSDFMIGAPNNNSGGQFAGKAYLLFGRKAAGWGMKFKLSDADASYTGEASQDLSGYCVCKAGDVNGDGYSDMLISALSIGKPAAGAGKTYLVLGGKGGVNSINDKQTLPKETALLQNYPNPFNPNTLIKFQLSDGGPVSLKIFDVLGNEVAVLLDEEKPAGNYEVKFDGKDLTSGIYFYTLQTGKYIQTKKLTLLK